MTLGHFQNKLGLTHPSFQSLPSLDPKIDYHDSFVHWSVLVSNSNPNLEIRSSQRFLSLLEEVALKMYTKGIVLNAEPLWGDIFKLISLDVLKQNTNLQLSVQNSLNLSSC